MYEELCSHSRRTFEAAPDDQAMWRWPQGFKASSWDGDEVNAKDDGTMGIGRYGRGRGSRADEGENMGDKRGGHCRISISLIGRVPGWHAIAAIAARDPIFSTAHLLLLLLLLLFSRDPGPAVTVATFGHGQNGQ
jgi:hypothetical protein